MLPAETLRIARMWQFTTGQPMSHSKVWTPSKCVHSRSKYLHFFYLFKAKTQNHIQNNNKFLTKSIYPPYFVLKFASEAEPIALRKEAKYDFDFWCHEGRENWLLNDNFKNLYMLKDYKGWRPCPWMRNLSLLLRNFLLLRFHKKFCSLFFSFQC